MDSNYEPGAWQWVNDQVQLYESSGGAEGNTLRDTGIPIVVITCTGAKSGKVRKFALMRVEHEAEYGLIASKGGDARHPGWYHNLIADPQILLQDGPEAKPYKAELVTGEERQLWWDRGVEVFDTYAEYAKRTDRQIPIFVARPA